MIAIFDNLGMSELMIVAVAALLLFGKRLPEVASQAGATLAKFRKGLDNAIHDSGVENEIRKIKSAMPTDLSVRDVARVAARKFEDRLRDEVDIPPISLGALSTKNTAMKPDTASTQGTPPTSTTAPHPAELNPTAPTRTTESNPSHLGGESPLDSSPKGTATSPPSGEAPPAAANAPKPGIDPASHFARSSNGVHPAGLNGQAEADRSATNTPEPTTSDTESVERAQQGGIQPRPLPPGSVPRD